MKWRIIWRVQIIQTDIINLYNIHVQKVANFSRGWKYILIQTKKKKRKENRENLCNTSFEPGFKIASLSRCCYGGHVSSTRYGWIKWPIRKSFFFPPPPLGWRYSRGRMTRVCSTSVDPKRKIKEGEGGGEMWVVDPLSNLWRQRKSRVAACNGISKTDRPHLPFHPPFTTTLPFRIGRRVLEGHERCKVEALATINLQQKEINSRKEGFVKILKIRGLDPGIVSSDRHEESFSIRFVPSKLFD